MTTQMISKPERSKSVACSKVITAMYTENGDSNRRNKNQSEARLQSLLSHGNTDRTTISHLDPLRPEDTLSHRRLVVA
jgi:hypothetical protein